MKRMKGQINRVVAMLLTGMLAVGSVPGIVLASEIRTDLSQNSPMAVEETEETLTDPDNRILHKVTVNDIPAANKLFDDLMGSKVIPRKEYIKLHSQEAVYAV